MGLDRNTGDPEVMDMIEYSYRQYFLNRGTVLDKIILFTLGSTDVIYLGINEITEQVYFIIAINVIFL